MKDTANKIRQSLSKLGYSPQEVSVRCNQNYTITVTSKTPNVDKKKVLKAVAKAFWESGHHYLCGWCDGIFLSGLKPVIPSPLTIEINEGLFCGGIKRFSDIILFGRARKNGRLAWIRVRPNGLILGALQFLNARQINEIIRVRAALGWDGKE